MLDLTMVRSDDFRRECARRREAGLVVFAGPKQRPALAAVEAIWDAVIGAWLLAREEHAAALGMRERSGARGRFFVAPDRAELDCEITIETQIAPAWRCRSFGCGEAAERHGLCHMHHYAEVGR